jgi:hypothetical protein
MSTSIKKFLAILGFAALLLEPAFVLAETSASADATAGVNASVPMVTGTPVNVSTHAAVGAKLGASAEARAGQEIDRRVTNLNALSTRVGLIKNLSDSDKASIQSSLSAQVSALSSLKAKIEADTDATVMKTDVQSVTASYRIYALVLPQVRIIAAADRIVSVAKNMQALGAKLQERITAAQSSGADVSASVAALADFNAKINDAATQAQGAVTEAAALTPDNGDNTKLAANISALKDARAKVVAGQGDLQAARKDAMSIITAVRGKPVSASASGNGSATAGASSGE